MRKKEWHVFVGYEYPLDSLLVVYTGDQGGWLATLSSPIPCTDSMIRVTHLGYNWNFTSQVLLLKVIALCPWSQQSHAHTYWKPNAHGTQIRQKLWWCQAYSTIRWLSRSAWSGLGEPLSCSGRVLSNIFIWLGITVKLVPHILCLRMFSL